MHPSIFYTHLIQFRDAGSKSIRVGLIGDSKLTVRVNAHGCLSSVMDQ